MEYPLLNPFHRKVNCTLVLYWISRFLFFFLSQPVSLWLTAVWILSHPAFLWSPFVSNSSRPYSCSVPSSGGRHKWAINLSTYSMWSSPVKFSNESSILCLRAQITLTFPLLSIANFLTFKTGANSHNALKSSDKILAAAHNKRPLIPQSVTFFLPKVFHCNLLCSWTCDGSSPLLTFQLSHFSTFAQGANSHNALKCNSTKSYNPEESVFFLHRFLF